MAGLERKAFVQFVSGQLELVLIVVDAGTMVIEDCGVGGVQLQGAVEFAESLVEGTARVDDMNLAAETVASILELGDAQAGPSRCKRGFLAGDAGEERMGAVEIGTRARAHHKAAEEGAGLEIFFADWAGQR